ncbi:hypothetical protein HG535_0B03480 [Zygotorulaspora mrakii]|uniref:Transmembrane protein n=1 Tax=Zygotorulaspora mrakii TaxID=42260 RepID=A0A7H9AZZ3_ZYGMR|nr:uncharacterized protein HG535_0B03480 [Zygotorulaspora mrakii]QLG71309.1 hypothetical protein HG535_0B03480 [Zygotorulaspora mrakii]
MPTLKQRIRNSSLPRRYHNLVSLFSTLFHISPCTPFVISTPRLSTHSLRNASRRRHANLGMQLLPHLANLVFWYLAVVTSSVGHAFRPYSEDPHFCRTGPSQSLQVTRIRTAPLPPVRATCIDPSRASQRTTAKRVQKKKSPTVRAHTSAAGQQRLVCICLLQRILRVLFFLFCIWLLAFPTNACCSASPSNSAHRRPSVPSSWCRDFPPSTGTRSETSRPIWIFFSACRGFCAYLCL